MFLNAQMHELLLILDRAKLETKDGEGWVDGHALRHIPKTVRYYAQRRGYITGEGRTNRRKFKITTAGRTALANNAGANLAVMDELANGFVPAGEAIPEAEFKGIPVRPGFVSSFVQPAVIDLATPAPQKKQRAERRAGRAGAGLCSGGQHPGRGLPGSQRPGGRAGAPEPAEERQP